MYVSEILFYFEKMICLNVFFFDMSLIKTFFWQTFLMP